MYESTFCPFLYFQALSQKYWDTCSFIETKPKTAFVQCVYTHIYIYSNVTAGLEIHDRTNPLYMGLQC